MGNRTLDEFLDDVGSTGERDDPDTDSTADDTPDRPADRTTDQPTDQIPDQTPDQPTERPADSTTERTTDQPTERPADSTIDQTPDQPVGESNDESFDTGGSAQPDESAGAGSVDPAVSTFEWTPGGRDCEDCGAAAKSLWRDGGRLVCDDCKAW